MKSIRNGEIDVLRFVFAMIIVCYHFSCFFDFGVYGNGGIAVEFFFYLTGGFMVLKHMHNTFENPYEEVYSFILNKIRSFYPYYVGAIFVQMVVYVLLDEIPISAVYKTVIRGIPNLLLIQILGIDFSGGADIGGSWFLSAMVIASFVLFYIFVRRGRDAIFIIFPLLGVILNGIQINQGLIDFSWGGYETYVLRLMRAFAGIALGAWGMGIALQLKRNIYNNIQKTVFTVIKVLCVLVAIGEGLFIFENAEVISFIIIPVIILSFSGCTFILKGNVVTDFLGRLSLIIYLTHFIIISIIKSVYPDANMRVIVCGIIICPLFAFIFKTIVDFFIKHLFVRISTFLVPSNLTD